MLIVLLYLSMISVLTCNFDGVKDNLSSQIHIFP